MVKESNLDSANEDEDEFDEGGPQSIGLKNTEDNTKRRIESFVDENF